VRVASGIDGERFLPAPRKQGISWWSLVIPRRLQSAGEMEGEESAADGAQGIGDPIVYVATMPAGSECLVPFIEDADAGEGEDDEGDEGERGEWRLAGEAKRQAEEGGSNGEVKQVSDLVEMRDFGEIDVVRRP
jgi:hypothetical protein